MATGVFVAVNTFDIHAGHRLMYIYCYIVAHSTVGHKQAPLLRVYNAGGQYGESRHVDFAQLFYAPVTRKEFDSIEININDEFGRPVSFKFGKSLVILHFRRSYSLP